MNTSVDVTVMRQMNRATVLRLLRDLRTTSRVDIAQMTGLNKATVSSIVDGLIEEQLIQEVGYGLSSGGRKPVLLRFNGSAAYAIGLDVQLNSITTVVSNIRGEVVHRNVESVILRGPSEVRRESLLRAIESALEGAVAATPNSAYGIVGACVGFPGMVNFQNGVVHYLPTLSFTDWHVADSLSGKFPFPIFCDNDANCGAWSEFQSRRSHSTNFVYLNVGIGIGTGIVIGNQLYRGHSGMAGEFGHMTINPMGSACPCGNYGCWEEYASERSLIRYIREAGGDPAILSDDRPLMDQVLKEARHDNRPFIRAFNSLGQYLGIGIANVVNALNPEEVILGGGVSSAATFILPEIERVLNHRALSLNKKVSIQIANANSVSVGAAFLALDHALFDAPSPTTGV